MEENYRTIGIVESASISTEETKRGLYIKFKSVENVLIESLVVISSNLKTFQVQKVTYKNGMYNCKAKELGLRVHYDVHLASIIKQDVKLVINPDYIQKLMERSIYY